MKPKKCSCVYCGAEFEVYCAEELREKMKNHKCKVPNKKRLRTLQLQQSEEDRFIQDLVSDRINEHNFDKLVQAGIVKSC